MIISAIGLFFASNILKIIGASERVIEVGAPYTRWLLGGNLVIMLLFLKEVIPGRLLKGYV